MAKITGRIDDGFATLIDIAGATLEEKTVTPPTMEAGGENDTTTMRNTEWRTKSPKQLKTLGEASFTAAYAPSAYSTLVTSIGTNQLITITFPVGGGATGATLAFWGWIDSFTPNEAVEGEMPTADVTIIASNQDATGAEIAPVYTAGT